MFKRIPDSIIVALAIILVGSWFIMLGFNIVMAGKAMTKPDVCKPTIVKEVVDPYKELSVNELPTGDAEAYK